MGAQGLVGDDVIRARSRALRSEYSSIVSNLEYAIAWRREEGLTSTPRAMSIRWCTTLENVLGGLRFLGGALSVRADREPGSKPRSIHTSQSRCGKRISPTSFAEHVD